MILRHLLPARPRPRNNGYVYFVDPSSDSDGKVHFSGKISTDSKTIQWLNFFHFIYGGSFFSIPANDGWIESPCVKYGSDYEWSFESTFDASLYDKIDSVILFGGCFECGEEKSLSIADHQPVEAQVRHKRHKEFEFFAIDKKGCYESESKLILHTDGVANFSGKLWTDSDSGQWFHVFNFRDSLDRFVFSTDRFWSPVVQNENPIEWKISFNFDASLYDSIDSCMLLYKCPCMTYDFNTFED